jgi:transcriptional regulator
MREARLANLVTATATATAEGLIATPLPLLIAPEEGPYGTLYGHLARANPQWRLSPVGDAMALFMGPDAYVSPAWYAAKREHGKVVPTWNYEAVHAAGPVEIVEDSERLHWFVSRLTAVQEAAQPRPWSVEDAPAPFVAGQLRGIVGVSLRVEKLVGKRKLSQNRPPADRDGAIAGLEASRDARDRDAASAMRAVAEGE